LPFFEVTSDWETEEKPREISYAVLAKSFRPGNRSKHCSSMMKHLVLSLALIVASQLPTTASAQSTDTTFTLRVAPRMSLRPLQGPRTANHPGTDGDLTFQNSSWLVSTASVSGSTVVFTTHTPFQLTSNPVHQRDVRLNVRQPFGSGGWSVDLAQDQSDYSAGDLEAQVQVSSNNSGFAFIFLNVTFLTGDSSTLTSGTYGVTVVGTVSAN